MMFGSMVVVEKTGRRLFLTAGKPAAMTASSQAIESCMERRSYLERVKLMTWSDDVTERCFADDGRKLMFRGTED